MDGNRFDDITRKLAADASRRSFLKRTAATVAALAGLGGVAATDAARRPTPTPKPLTCSAPKVASGGQCVCPGGTTPCGPDCCGAGGQCCDNACCYGQCYGEELCCPTGQLLCGSSCLPPGACCGDSDCGLGTACVDNICVCQATVSCETAGYSCGPLIDDCGNQLDCGSCTPPNTCGGDGIEGACGCTPTSTCQTKCGSFVDECGIGNECGDFCGPCQICGENNTCVPANEGAQCGEDCVRAVCTQGQCTALETLDCPFTTTDPHAECRTYFCIQGDNGPECIYSSANDGDACAVADLCSVGVCEGALCNSTPKECGECEICRNGECVQDDDCSCLAGLTYVNGHCCNLPTIGGSPPRDPSILGSCFASDQTCCTLENGPCCPVTTGGGAQCCDMCVSYRDPSGVDQTKCCEPEQICGGGCCWLTDTCVDGQCVDRDMVCSGNTACGDKCCGGTGNGDGACCGAQEFCVNGACVPTSATACSDHDFCETVYDSSAVCAGMSINLGTGQINPGTCCPGNYWKLITSGSNSGQYTCCAPGTHVTQFGCDSYLNSECGGFPCSRTTIRRWGS